MAIWYVRPLNATPHSGTADGRSYLNAWKGANTIVWGSGGVVAGDTLYVCDHWADFSVSLTANNMTVGASGTSGSPIIIRGDLTDHPGTMCSGYIKAAAGSGAWTLLESGVYRFSSTSGTVYRWLQDKAVLGFVAPGTYSTPPSSAEMAAMPEGTSYRDGSGYRYVKLSGLADPDDYDMVLVSPGNTLNIIGNNYVTVQNLSFFAGSPFVRQADGITLDGLAITSSSVGIPIGNLTDSGDCSNLVIKNCSIDYCYDGIYSYYGATAMTVQNCTITNCVDDVDNYLVFGAGIDNHCVGIMGFGGHLIDGCTFINGGSGVTLYDGHSSNPGVTIQNCWAEDMYRPATCTNNGVLDCHGAGFDIHLSGGVDPGNVTFKVHNCVAINCDGCGIRSLDNPYAGRTSTFELYNNTIIGCQIGIAPHNSTTANGYQHIKNNIIYEPTDRSNGLNCSFIDWASGAAIDSSNNLFYSSNANWPSTAALFYQRTSYLTGNQWTIAQWQASTYSPDTDAETSDPLFTDAANGDFTLQAGSPCIDAGTDTGLTTDYLGNPRPYGSGWDIGAYEYVLAAQYGRPASDVNAGTWTAEPAGDLYGAIDETTYSDADYCYSRAQADAMEVALGTLFDPSTSSGHVLRYRGVGSYTVSLREGTATEIASWVESDASLTTHERTLSEAEANSITDYGDLRVRIVSGSS